MTHAYIKFMKKKKQRSYHFHPAVSDILNNSINYILFEWKKYDITRHVFFWLNFDVVIECRYAVEKGILIKEILCYFIKIKQKKII